MFLDAPASHFKCEFQRQTDTQICIDFFIFCSLVSFVALYLVYKNLWNIQNIEQGENREYKLGLSCAKHSLGQLPLAWSYLLGGAAGAAA